ncbi:hypothetical protein EPD60_06485 [Flaviaesturariibacter flavus]|uniref:Uncharacterized protein n=1 Tax=Flaviaesturariibacter flavus TaxID=2502780 RepID=A0A4R1BKG8_9BACT|nr:hypothetical protein [Flaviaesturariibacter flavus]TCJ17826.1 hypothetical protein EPD60_06485 [Flaviaesturariibacter flavus]
MDKPLTNHMGLPNEPGYNDNLPDMTPRREGGMESFAESDPSDPRNDEKVIANRSESERTEAPGDAAGDNSAPRSSEDSDSSR